MKKNPIALGCRCCCFVAWMAYLGVQTAKYRHPPVIVSHAQLMNANYDVEAELKTADGKVAAEVTVKSVLFANGDRKPGDGATITVQNLAGCDGFTGPGTYICR